MTKRKISLKRALKFLGACPEGIARAGNQPARVAWRRAKKPGDLLYIIEELTSWASWEGGLAERLAVLEGEALDIFPMPPVPEKGLDSWGRTYDYDDPEYLKADAAHDRKICDYITKRLPWKDVKAAVKPEYADLVKRVR